MSGAQIDISLLDSVLSDPMPTELISFPTISTSIVSYLTEIVSLHAPSHKRSDFRTDGSFHLNSNCPCPHFHW